MGIHKFPKCCFRGLKVLVKNMKLLTKTPVAAIIMIAVIILSALFGCRRSLLKEQKTVENYFFNGIDGDGYSIQNDLETICATSVNMKTIASRYIEVTDPLITEMTNARQALTDAHTVSEKYTAAMNLYDAVTTLYNSLDPNMMNSTDKGFRASLYDDITSAMQRISHNGYNDAAREFNSILESFPAKYIAKLVGIEPAQLYG